MTELRVAQREGQGELVFDLHAIRETRGPQWAASLCGVWLPLTRVRDGRPSEVTCRFCRPKLAELLAESC